MDLMPPYQHDGSEIGNQEYCGYVDDWNGRQVRGWAWGGSSPERKPHVFVLADGDIVDCVLPHMYRPDIQKTYGGDGINGFVVNVSDAVRSSARSLEILFETGQPLNGGTIGLQRWRWRWQRSVPRVHCVLRDGGVIFLHIQKTAGTSVRRVFHNHFGEENIFYVYPAPPGMSRHHLSQIPMAQRAKISCVFGHEFYGIHTLLPGRWRYVTVLRDPVARIISNYHHQKRNGVLLPPLLEVLRCPPMIEFDNLMVRVLAGVDAGVVPLGRVNESVLEHALLNARLDFSFIGVLENRIGLTDGLSRVLGRPMIDLQSENVGAYGACSNLTENELAAIRRCNKFDVMLYDALRGTTH